MRIMPRHAEPLETRRDSEPWRSYVVGSLGELLVGGFGETAHRAFAAAPRAERAGRAARGRQGRVQPGQHRLQPRQVRRRDRRVREGLRAVAVPDILFNLGQCYRKQWEAEKRSELGRRALHYYDALVREAPQSKVRPDANRFIAELGPAVALAEAQERQGLIATTRGADALKLAQTMFAAGQLQDAAGVLERLFKEPGNGRELLAEAYLLRGRVAAGLGDVLGAEAQFKRALELRPSAEIVDARPQEAGALRRRAGRGARRACSSCRRRSARCPRGSRRASTSESRATPSASSARSSSRTARRQRRVPRDALPLRAHRRRGDGGQATHRHRPARRLRCDSGDGAGSRDARRVPGARVDAQGSALAESGTATLPFRLQVAAAAIAASRRGRARFDPVVQALVGLDDCRRGRNRRRRRGLRGHARERRRTHQ